MGDRSKFYLPVNWPMVFLILSLYIMGFLLYPYLPEMMPSHWNVAGQVDGYTPKNVYLIFLPSLILGIYLLISFAPALDPRPESYRKFRGVVEGFRIIIVLVFASIYVATILFALGIPVSVGKVVRFMLGLMLVFIGNYFGKVRHNYTFGIKTPWTLASEEVWNKTHRVSGPLWVVAGFVWMISIFMADRPAFIIDMAVLAAAAIFGFIYSCLLFNKSGK
ncbi:SdpI family protein [Thermoanaerobacterium sp. DL9XJH110]|uniref:SdpI family protein n=1 Tax=Thermoanaerobacterium sp. DL9XJH110 TaxID=3386643 RepID=UPI003BB6C897